MGTLLDETTTWAEFGQKHLDRRLTKALTKTLKLERPTLVQTKGIPIALQGKDVLCRARTGSGKTLAYGVPMVQILLTDTEAGNHTPVRGLVLVPTKELCAQVHGVFSSLLSFCFETLTVEALLPGQKYLKAELPTVLITTPSSALTLFQQRKKSRPLSETLKMLIVDEADLMFSFGYEEATKKLCTMLPSTYQAMLVSATLSEEVEQLKGLMLHKPAVLKLEEPEVTGKLNQFYLRARKYDKWLILYALLKLRLVQGRILMFVNSTDHAYEVKLLLERFSINSAVVSAELPHSTRQNIIQAFNQGIVELLISTDTGLTEDDEDEEEDEDEDDEDGDDEENIDAEEEEEEGGPDDEGEEEEDDEEDEKDNFFKSHQEESDEEDEDEEEEEEEEDAEEDAVEEEENVSAKGGSKPSKKALPDKPKKMLTNKEVDFSMTRGVDLVGVTAVINADMPASTRAYVHRVGRTARGGASGTALTICCEGEEGVLKQILKEQGEEGAEVQKLPLQMKDIERFRYRVEDIAKGVTKKAVRAYRARELQLEALNSERLKAYFEDNIEDKKALQKSQRGLKDNKARRDHLKSVPFYLVPEQFFNETPVQKAVKEAASNTTERNAKKRSIQARDDPLRSFEGHVKKRRKVTHDMMAAKQAKQDPKLTNIEDLPPLSGRKLWKLRHKKHLVKRDIADGGPVKSRKKPLMLKRAKKFGHNL